MDNKLSELSKPVAWTTREELIDAGAGAAFVWKSERGLNDELPLYSQEYVSALLAELEAKDERIAELEEQSKQLKKEPHNEGAANAYAYERIRKLEKRLATPVRLPRPACTYADHSYPAYSRKQVEGIITSAGMRFTVEGDE